MDLTKRSTSVVVIGHVDAGKSTTIGHLIYKCGGVDESTMEKYEKEAAEMGKESFEFAWVLDKLHAERQRGLSMEVAFQKLETTKHSLTIIDVPGHRDFIKNMISGATQADCALLVVSAVSGEFEAGVSENGQTREHALLAFSLGITQLIVAVNKMDRTEPPNSEDRFRKIVKELSACLKSVGYDSEGVPFVPVSGWLGDNLVKSSESFSWFEGWKIKRKIQGDCRVKTILESLENLYIQPRPQNIPLRLPLQDAYRIESIGTVAVGRVETGILKSDTTLAFAPANLTSKIESIETQYGLSNEAMSGDTVHVNIKNVSVLDIKPGSVAGDLNNDPPKKAISFDAKITVMNHPSQIHVGYTPIVDCHTAHVPCRFNELRTKLDRQTDRILEDNPEFLKSGDTAIVNLIPKKPICVEAFDEYAPLGRIVIRDRKSTVAVGIIKRVVKKEPEDKN